jgi:hypothetical protein
VANPKLINVSIRTIEAALYEIYICCGEGVLPKTAGTADESVALVPMATRLSRDFFIGFPQL